MVKAILIGAGQRGAHSYAPYALKHPEDICFVGVAEPDDERRKWFCNEHGIKEEYSFSSYEDLLASDVEADCALVCTQDNQHYEPCVACLKRGLHVLLEKPMSKSSRECVEMGRLAKKYGKNLSICHVLRYTPFYDSIKQLISSGKIGKVMTMTQTENVAFYHYAHSFVRGNWNNSRKSSPMILAKSCHDMDIILYLVGSHCTRISSFGSLSYFTSSNAPEGAPMYCHQNCPHEKDCPYHAGNFYTKSKRWEAPIFRDVVSPEKDDEKFLEILKTSPYGRCVFHCDNDVVDHQVVNMEFESGANATFNMVAFTGDGGRQLKIMGTKGAIEGNLDTGLIKVFTFMPDEHYEFQSNSDVSMHMGGDDGIMRDFIKVVESDGKFQGRSSADISVESHLMALAAEKSRVEGRIVDMKEVMDAE